MVAIENRPQKYEFNKMFYTYITNGWSIFYNTHSKQVWNEMNYPFKYTTTDFLGMDK